MASSSNLKLNSNKSTKKSLSGTILEYYNKYGQNRDLEKYLRFRRGQSSSCSSSTQSNAECPGICRLGRSLEDLYVAGKNPPKSSTKSKSLPIQNSPSQKNKSKSSESIECSPKMSKELLSTDKKAVSDEQIVKPKNKIPNKGSNKKSFNFNMESNIVINVSPPDCPSIVDKKDFESQTDVADTSIDNHPSASAASSPASVSNKNRLEWDSMADVGYTDKSSEKPGETTLSTLERRNLKKMFTDRGLNIDEKLIVLAAQGTTTDNKVPKNDNKVIETQPKRDSKTNWKTALKKFREKYKNDDIESPSPLCFTNPNIHSTPNVASSNSKNVLFKDAGEQTSLKFVDDKANKIEPKYAAAIMLEKSCQTSTIEMQSKEIQVSKSLPSNHSPSISDHSSIDTINIDATNKKNENEKCPTIADGDSSFEFVSPKTYEKDRQNANKENIEFVPSAVEKSSLSSQKESKPKPLPIELKNGIDYLNALLESTEIDNEIKKEKMRKIIMTLVSNKFERKDSNKQSIPLSSSSWSSNSRNSNQESSKNSSKKALSGIQTISPSTNSSTNQSHHNDPKVPNSTMIDFLRPVTHSEIDFNHHLLLDKQKIEQGQQKIMENLLNAQKQKYDSDKQQICWIDNEIKRLAALKEQLIGENVSSDIIYENIRKSNENPPSKQPNSLKSTSKAESSKSKKNSASKLNTDRLTGWDSHEKFRKTCSSRTKLQTPGVESVTDNNAIADYAQKKLKQFINKYENNSGKLYAEQPEIYTQPYSSDHYSEPHNIKTKSTHSKITKNDAYTSMSGGSDVFLSSTSVSIPDAANLSSHTTSHQYDTRASVAIQTNDSLRRTAPIFIASPLTEMNQLPCNCPNPNGCLCNCKNIKKPQRRTVRVTYVPNDKQQQTMPESIAYVLTFDNQPTTSKSNQENSSKRTLNTSSSSQSSSGLQSPKLSLRQYLEHRRPDFCSNAEDRRKCLQEIHNLRLKQCEQRNKLLLLTSTNTLRNYLSNAAPVVTSKRAFTSTVFRAHTKRKYNQLPEIVKRNQLEKEKKLRRNQRIIADSFKKNLQKRVLIGKPDLSNSMTLIPI